MSAHVYEAGYEGEPGWAFSMPLPGMGRLHSRIYPTREDAEKALAEEEMRQRVLAWMHSEASAYSNTTPIEVIQAIHDALVEHGQLQDRRPTPA